uniref:Uncharacterized protein n=1 Tax=Tetranychus urticae TaxID=32264 RepID=T1JTF1_TETUR
MAQSILTALLTFRNSKRNNLKIKQSAQTQKFDLAYFQPTE